MPQESNHPTRLVLVDDAALGRIHVDMEAFFELSFWMAEELEDLVARWRHWAAPNASGRTADSLDDRRV